jgi:hypothetical protein
VAGRAGAGAAALRLNPRNPVLDRSFHDGRAELAVDRTGGAFVVDIGDFRHAGGRERRGYFGRCRSYSDSLARAPDTGHAVSRAGAWHGRRGNPANGPQLRAPPAGRRPGPRSDSIQPCSLIVSSGSEEKGELRLASIRDSAVTCGRPLRAGEMPRKIARGPVLVRRSVRVVRYLTRLGSPSLTMIKETLTTSFFWSAKPIG